MHQLLAHLATWPQGGRFQSHTYQKIGGGANNILYKVSGEGGDFAVKFTLRDGRRRAWREFQALTTLQAHGLTIAPRPILLDETSYPQPVVVQTWLEGEVTAVPPQTDVDANTLNFIRRPGAWASVDWENMGGPPGPCPV